MTNQDREHESTAFEERTRAVFDASVENLDGRTRSQLNQARQAALRELDSGRARWWRQAWLPAGGVAAAAVLAVWMTLGPGASMSTLDQGGLPVEDLEIFADAPSFDLLEDVEFYAWVAEETGNSG